VSLLEQKFLHVSHCDCNDERAILLLILTGFLRASRASSCPIYAVGVVICVSLAVSLQNLSCSSSFIDFKFLLSKSDFSSDPAGFMRAYRASDILIYAV
jgi:hypothetical protein